MSYRISLSKQFCRTYLIRILAVTGLAVLFANALIAQVGSAGAIQAIEEGSSSSRESSGRVSPVKGEVKPFKPAHRPAEKASAKTSVSTRSIRPEGANTDSSRNIRPDGTYAGPVLGDSYTFLNFEVVSKVQPVWTIAAKNAHALGLVQVVVLIGENGRVLEAKARTGNPLLHPEAVKAALATGFNRPTVNGQPARALGFLVYRFGRVEDASEEDGGPPNRDNEPIPEYVTDGKLNREAIVLPKLDYKLKPGEGGGIVWVSITVDERGNVIEAWGDAPYDPALKSALEKAARGAKFKPRLVRGHPVKVKATLSYELKP